MTQRQRWVVLVLVLVVCVVLGATVLGRVIRGYWHYGVPVEAVEIVPSKPLELRLHVTTSSNTHDNLTSSVLAESESEVIVEVVRDAAVMEGLVAVPRVVRVTLSAPLEGRHVVDGSTGEPVPVIR